MADRRQYRPPLARFYGIAINFAAAVAGLTFVGYWIDRLYGCSPWGVVSGAALGLVGGSYNFVRESLRAVRESERRARDGGGESDGGSRDA